MTFDHITSPEIAIACAETSRFLPADFTDDRGINFLHPFMGIGGNNPKADGAKLVCDWGGPIEQSSPKPNAAGYFGKALIGQSGTLYIDPHPRAFLPIGTVNDLHIVSIDSFSASELEGYVYKLLASKKPSVTDRLLGKQLTITDSEVLNKANALRNKYGNVNIPLRVG